MTLARARRSPLLLASVAALLAAAAPARAAAAEGFATDRFRPAPAGDAFFSVEAVARPASELDAPPRLNAALVLDYARAPLVLRRPDGEGALEAGQIVRHQAFARVDVAYLVSDRLVAWLDLPCLLATAGDASTEPIVGLRAPSGAALGDVRLGARVRLLGAPDAKLQLGLAHALTLPTGDPASYAGDGRVGFDETLVAGGLVDARRGVWSTTVGLRLRPAHAIVDKRIGNEITFGAAYAMLASKRRVSLGLEAFGAAGIGAGTRGVALEVLVAARARVSRWVFGAAAGPGLTSGPGTPSWRLLATVAWSPF